MPGRRRWATLRTLLPGVLFLVPGLALEAQVQDGAPRQGPTLPDSWQLPFVQPSDLAVHPEAPDLLPRPNEGEASWDELVGGAVMGGLAGMALGVGGAALLSQAGDCGYGCIGAATLMVFGGGSLGIAAGVHSADRGQGSFAGRALLSTGVGVGGVVVLRHLGAPALLAVPALQILALTFPRMRRGS